jgi:HK97 family phage portal protein
MGWIDKFKRKPKVNTVYADMLNGYTPIFSQFGQNIYASDVVQQAIMCIVSELKKLIPTHVIADGADVKPVPGNVQNVLNNPNELMTTSEFIEKFVWNLFFNYNSFIIPTFTSYIDAKGVEQRTYNGLYPVQPTNVEFQQDSYGKLYVKMTFANGYETFLPYDDVIHIKYKYSVNDYMGGNESGQPDNEALLQTLQLNKDLLTGVSHAMKSSFAINGVVKINTMLDDGKTETALKELEAKLKKSESGFLPLDIKSEFIPITHDIELVDADTLKFIDEKILRHFGVPLCILTGDYAKEQYEAFYQKTLEPIIKSISEAFTKTLFTSRMRSYNNKIVFYPKDLIFMSVTQTLEMVRLLGDSGALYENEKRVAFGLRPLEELNGVRMQSLNYVNVDLAKNYQTGGGNDATGTDENNTGV